ncbi:MAG: class I SAM-dependent methyltransferase [Planctomycetota bacterium]
MPAINGNTPLDEATARWLVSDEAKALCDSVAGRPTHQAIAQLRKHTGAERAAAVVELVELRRRAAAKFPKADRMYFTRVGLEQATDWWVATHKAERFASAARRADLCCGIGGDLVASAGGSAVGYDLCPVAVTFAAANAAALDRTGVSVQTADADAAPLEEFDAWHADPDRRPTGRRTTRVDLHSPGTHVLEAWRQRNANAAIKLAPAAEPPPAWADECELQWISRGGECKQLVVWSGNLATAAGERRAAALGPRGEPRGEVLGQPEPPAPIAGTLGESIYEPDAAAFASSLDGLIAHRHTLERVSSSGGYLTGKPGITAPLLTEFRIQAVTPLRTKTIAALLRERAIGRLEIKSRGVSIDPHALRKQLKPTGDNEATLLLTQCDRKAIAILAHRVSAEG